MLAWCTSIHLDTQQRFDLMKIAHVSIHGNQKSTNEHQSNTVEGKNKTMLMIDWIELFSIGRFEKIRRREKFHCMTVEYLTSPVSEWIDEKEQRNKRKETCYLPIADHSLFTQSQTSFFTLSKQTCLPQLWSNTRLANRRKEVKSLKLRSTQHHRVHHRLAGSHRHKMKQHRLRARLPPVWPIGPKIKSSSFYRFETLSPKLFLL